MTRSQPETVLNVGVDVRCLARDISRGIARFTRCASAALADRDDVRVHGYSDRAVEMPFPVSVPAARSTVTWEQVALPRALRSDGMDVLLSPANRGLPLLSGVPGVLVVHDAEEWNASTAVPSELRARLHFAHSSAISLATASRIVTVSRFSAEEIVRRLRVERERLSMVSEAVAPQLTRQVASGELSAFRRRHGIGERAVLYFGGGHPKKRFQTLIDAFAMVEDRHAQLVLAGDFGDLTPEMRERLVHHRIDDRTVMTGAITDQDLAPLYHSASIFVFPAVREGFGLPALEAMSAGTPVVLARSGALPEIGGDAAAYFEPDDPEDLAGVLTRLLADRDSLAELGRAARARAAQFSWERSAGELAAVLHQASGVRLRGRVVGPLRRLRHVPRWIRPT